MPLKVKSIVPEPDYIEFEKDGVIKKIWVEADLPEDILFEHWNISYKDPEKPTKEEFNNIIEINKKILKSVKRNKPEDVDELFESSKYMEKCRIAIFISKFIQGASEDMQKKSNESKT